MGILLVSHVVPKIPLKAVGDKRINYVIKRLSVLQKTEIRTNIGKICVILSGLFFKEHVFLEENLQQEYKLLSETREEQILFWIQLYMVVGFRVH